MYSFINLYDLSLPTKKEIALRNKKIQACKEQMGDKWLLAKSIKKKETK